MKFPAKTLLGSPVTEHGGTITLSDDYPNRRNGFIDRVVPWIGRKPCSGCQWQP